MEGVGSREETRGKKIRFSFHAINPLFFFFFVSLILDIERRRVSRCKCRRGKWSRGTRLARLSRRKRLGFGTASRDHRSSKGSRGPVSTLVIKGLTAGASQVHGRRSREREREEASKVREKKEGDERGRRRCMGAASCKRSSHNAIAVQGISDAGSEGGRERESLDRDARRREKMAHQEVKSRHNKRSAAGARGEGERNG